MVHNWCTVEFREFDTYNAARAAFDAGLNLRRFLVRIHNANEADLDNGHGWMLPWDELNHGGWGSLLDNGMRHELLARLG